MNFNSSCQKLLSYWKHPKFAQVFSLYLVNIATIPVGVVTSVLLTQYLGPDGYGDYQFVNNLFTFFVILATLGFFQAANRAIVLSDDLNHKSELYGTTLISLGFLFIIMAFAMTIYGLIDPNLHDKKLDKLLIFLIPFGWVYLLINYFEVLFQADNRINYLGISRLVPKILFLCCAVILSFYTTSKDNNRQYLTWFFYLFTQIIVFVFILLRLKLSLKNFRKRFTEIYRYNKSFGFDVYLGSIFAVGLSQITGIIISYYGMDNKGVGFYSLALTFASPLMLIPNTLATTNYKNFANQNEISKKLFFFTALLSLFSLILLWVIIGPFITYFYGVRFQPVIYLNYIVSIGVAFHGLADFFNRFLGAHGKGKMLRNSSIIIGISLLVFNLTLIPLYGEKGAAYTRLLSGIIYFLNMVYYYFLFLRKKRNNPGNF